MDTFLRTGIKPRQWQMLVALDDLRNLGRAASSLNVSQPAVSLALGQLERGLGMRLFERTPRGVVPNTYGECLIRQARSVLGSLAQVRDELRALQSGDAGTLTLGALPAMTPELVPRALAALKNRAPLTRVVVLEGSMESLLLGLRRGAVDLIVGRLSTPGGSDDLQEEALYEGRNVLVVGSRHPLVRHKRLVWSALVAHPWVLPPTGSLSRQPIESALQDNGCTLPTDLLETMSVPLIVRYLQDRPAVGVLSQGLARHYVGTGELSVLPLELPNPLRPIGISRSRNRPLSTAAESCLVCLREAAGVGQG